MPYTTFLSIFFFNLTRSLRILWFSRQTKYAFSEILLWLLFTDVRYHLELLFACFPVLLELKMQKIVCTVWLKEQFHVSRVYIYYLHWKFFVDNWNGEKLQTIIRNQMCASLCMHGYGIHFILFFFKLIYFERLKFHSTFTKHVSLSSCFLCKEGKRGNRKTAEKKTWKIPSQQIRQLCTSKRL